MKPIRYRISRPSRSWIIDIEMSNGEIITLGDIDYESLRNEVHSKYGFDCKSVHEILKANPHWNIEKIQVR